MSQATIKCLYCDTMSYSNRILGHILSHHQEAFFNDPKFYSQFRVISKDSKRLGEFALHKDGAPIHCCFGCNSTFRRGACASKHMKEKECLERHAKFIASKIVPFALKADELKTVSSETDAHLLEKLQALEKQNAVLQKQIQGLKSRLQDSEETADDEMNKRLCLQEIVDEELTEEQRRVFKRILARKNPEFFKDLYDVTDYEVSVDDSESEEESENEEEEKEKPYFSPPKNIVVSAKSIQPQYKIFWYKDQALFTDGKGILYDKSHRGEYVRCGALKNGEIEWD